VASILALLLLAIGFGIAIVQPTQTGVSSTHPNPASPTLPTGGRLIGLGDSLTRGVGDASGQGYFGIVKTSLQKRATSPFEEVNLAVNGRGHGCVENCQNHRVACVGDGKVERIGDYSGPICTMNGGFQLVSYYILEGCFLLTKPLCLPADRGVG
jgi:hypothetical protein